MFQGQRLMNASDYNVKYFGVRRRSPDAERKFIDRSLNFNYIRC